MSFKDFFKRHYLAVYLGVIVVLAVVISIIVGVVFNLYPLPTFEKPTKESVQSQPNYASPGQLVSGFPAELVLDSNAAVKESYSIDYGKNTNQYTASFNSNESMESLYSSYKKYLEDNGWSITNEITKYPTSRGLYAVKGLADASVAIIDKSDARQVTVSYLQK